MNILIGKVGGAGITFNRKSCKALRSNNNGNVDTYNFFKILLDNLKDCNFYIIGENDYNTLSDVEKYDNVKGSCLLDTNNVDIDVCFIMGGLTSYDNNAYKDNVDIPMFLNRSKAKWYLFSTDPRCYCNYPWLTNKPKKIFSLGNDVIKIAREEVVVEPLMEMLSLTCYKYKKTNCDTKTKLCVISTSESDTYPRVENMLEIIGDNNLPIYGRCPSYKHDDRFVGEVKVDEIRKVYCKSCTTLLTPIKTNWFTGKFMESLMYDMVPLFGEDYGTDLLLNDKNIKDILTCNNSDFLQKMFLFSHKYYRKTIVEKLKNLVYYEEMVSGKKFMEIIQKLLKEK